MTGMIMIRMSTDMYHHCGPRVAFCADTRTGIVWAFAVVRNSARRYSFHANTSTRMTGRHEARRGHRQDDRAEDPVGRGAVHGRRLLELRRDVSEVVPHEPDDDGQVRRPRT